jgi:tetratricopeptide (TPR) repeat protein
MIAAAALAALAGTAGIASAATNEYTPLMKAEKYAEAERLAGTRLAADPRNAEAMIAKGEALMAQGSDKLDEAIKHAELCVATHPLRSECHEALGAALGTKAASAGMMAAMGSVGKIKDAMKKSVELDPKSLTARYALMQFYIMAPGIAGGSTSKARELAAETAQFSPEAGKLMQARMLLADKEFAKAETILLSVNAGGHDVLSRWQRGMLGNVGFKYLEDKKYADGDRIFHDMQKRFPDHDLPLFGQARVLQEQGKHAAAIAMLDKAIGVAPAPRAHFHFRLGQSLQASNDKAKAVAAYEKALAIKPALSKQQQEDASAQLKALKV